MSDIDNDVWDFWDSVGLVCAGYDSSQDMDLINVFKETAKDKHWYVDIAESLSLDVSYVRLLIEILCSAGFCEYGTSPRGAWAIPSDYASNLDKLLLWYKIKWE